MGFGVTCVHFPLDDEDGMADASVLTAVADAYPVLDAVEPTVELLLPSGEKTSVDGLHVEAGRGKVSMVSFRRLQDTGLETCTALFALAQAARFTICNEQASRANGTDMALIVQELADEAIEDWMRDSGYRRITSPEALMDAFAGSYDSFTAYRDQVIGRPKG